MTRCEENKMVINEILEKAESLLNQPKTYKETIMFHLGVINTVLTDISKSLAIIANKIENEGI